MHALDAIPVIGLCVWAVVEAKRREKPTKTVEKRSTDWDWPKKWSGR